jgi:hypothetical protein
MSEKLKRFPGARPDFSFEDHGELWLLRPMNHIARTHLLEHLGDVTWFGGAVAVEPRYVAALTAGLDANGFTVDGGVLL